jgi:signal transduction histidine kinase
MSTTESQSVSPQSLLRRTATARQPGSMIGMIIILIAILPLWWSAVWAGPLVLIGLALIWYGQPSTTASAPLAMPPITPGHAYCVVDHDWTIAHWHGDPALLGMPSSDLLSGLVSLRDFFSAGENLDELIGIPCALQRPDQSLIAVQMLDTRWPDLEEGLRCVHLRDITDDIDRQAKLMESEAELRMVFDTIDECVLLLGLDGTITNANASARSRYGNRIIDTDIVDALRREDEPDPHEVLRYCLAEFKPATMEQHLSTQNRTVEIHVYPIFNTKGSMRQFLFLERDITSQRLMEIEIRVQHRKVHDALERLRELDQAKTKWLGSVSHELRTPLTSIRSYSELLLTYPETDKETRDEFTSIIFRESERLTRLIEDLLDLATIESGNLQTHITEVDLMTLAQETTASLQALADPRGIRLQIGLDGEQALVASDADRLRQVQINLLSNAIKFSPIGGLVRLDLTCEDDLVHFAVEDDGPGITPADRRRVFGRFTQLSSDLTDKPTGTGLGLTICAELVEHLGGSIRCLDPLHLSGTRFLVSLPRRGPDLPAGSTGEPVVS